MVIKFKYAQNLKVLLLLMSIIGLVFIVLEQKVSYFFLQDDNRQYTLPLLVHNFESLLNFQIPQFNFHQYLGIPAMSYAQSGTFYPIYYLGLFISKIFFGHYFAAIDIISYIHLVIGAFGFFLLIKQFGFDNKISIFGALTWVLNSFVIYVGDSWCTILAITAYFPFMLLFSIKIYSNYSLKSFILSIITKLLFFYMGNFQFFMYGLIFEFLTLSIYIYLNNKSNVSKKYKKNNGFLQKLKEVYPIRLIKLYAINYIVSLMLSMPLLLPAYIQMNLSYERSTKLAWERYARASFNMLDYFQGIFFPFLNNSNSISSDTWIHLHKLSYIGYLPIIFIIIALYSFLRKKYSAINKLLFIASIIMGILAFIWSSNILIHYILYYVPIINRVKDNFKLGIFTNFYLILISCIGFSILIEKISKYNKNNYTRVISYALIAIHIINFSIIYKTSDFSTFGFLKETPPLHESLKNQLADGRNIPIGFSYLYENENNKGIPNLTQGPSSSLGQNFCTMWNLYSFLGYEPIISKDSFEAVLGFPRYGITPQIYNKYREASKVQDLVNYMRIWGLKYYITSNEFAMPLDASFEEKYKDNTRTIFYDKLAKPLFYWQTSGNEDFIKSKIGINTIKLSTTNESEDSLIINFLYNSNFNVYIDGVKSDLKKSDYNQMKVNILKGNHQIILNYSDPYFKAGYIIFIATLIVLIIYLLYVRYLRLRNLQS